MIMPLMLPTRTLAGTVLAIAASSAVATLAAVDTAEDARDTRAPRIAITIDDLPWLGPAPPGEDRAAVTRRLLAHLRARDIRATGFVVCGQIGDGDDQVLRLWLDSGMELGNHSQSHRDLNDAPLAGWLADVRSCDATLRAVAGEPIRLFRYPYLHQGPTAERKSAAGALLGELGYQTAHVSVDNSEWILRRPYDEAIRAGDLATRQRIASLFVDHILDAVAHYQSVARERVGRDVDHVLLLHANALVADQLGTLLDSLAARGFEFVTLDEALRDPAYDRVDGYVGLGGLSWLYRLEPAVPERVRWDDEQAARLREALEANR